MSAVLDTSVLISDWRPADDESCAVSVCSIAELHVGVLRAVDAQVRSRRLQRLAAVESAFDPIPVDEPVARAFAECASAVVDAGRNPRPRSFDLVIAATARVHRARLITLNPHDFRGLEALVEIYCPSV